ncbi:MAG: hypothetical protein AABY83_11140 [Pseudomonadota bacterium]
MRADQSKKQPLDSDQALLDDACRTVLPMLSNQIDLAKKKTEAEISRLVGSFLELKNNIDTLSGQDPKISVTSGVVSGTLNATPEIEGELRKAMEDLPNVLAKMLRSTDDLLHFGDKICLHGADLYQAAASNADSDDKKYIAIAMKIVVSAFEVMEFGRSIQDNLKDCSVGIPVLLNSLVATIDTQQQVISEMQAGKVNAQPAVNPASKNVVNDINKNIGQIIEGFQFQDGVCQTLDSVMRSMQDFVESVPALKSGVQGGRVNLKVLLNLMNSHNVTSEQRRIMGDKNDGAHAGDVILL